MREMSSELTKRCNVSSFSAQLQFSKMIFDSTANMREREPLLAICSHFLELSFQSRGGEEIKKEYQSFKMESMSQIISVVFIFPTN